jgi:predicted HTH transcriptional regulator
MPFYTKPISQLDIADLRELLAEQAVENLRLEFKLKVPDKEDTLKKLSAFANTFGGFMVVGAEQEKDGRIKGLPGVDVESGYKQKIVDWCSSKVSPPFFVEVSDPIRSPAGNGKVCYVMYAAESETAPHFINGRRGVWVRTDEFLKRFEAQQATGPELRQLFGSFRARKRDLTLTPRRS